MYWSAMFCLLLASFPAAKPVHLCPKIGGSTLKKWPEIYGEHEVNNIE